MWCRNPYRVWNARAALRRANVGSISGHGKAWLEKMETVAASMANGSGGSNDDHRQRRRRAHKVEMRVEGLLR